MSNEELKISPGVFVMEYDTNIHNIEFDPFVGVTVGLKRLRDSAVEPALGTQGAACFDLSASFEPGMEIAGFNEYNEKFQQGLTVDGEFVLYPGRRALIPTGWVFDIPVGFSMRIHPRSGIAWKNGVTLMNAEGVVDWDYTNETYVMLVNNSSSMFAIKNGDRIAQAEISIVFDTRFRQVSEISQKTDRIGGIGSTGV